MIQQKEIALIEKALQYCDKTNLKNTSLSEIEKDRATGAEWNKVQAFRGKKSVILKR